MRRKLNADALKGLAEKVLSQGDTFHILVAFNREAYEVNKPLLKLGTVLVYDSPGEDLEPEPIDGVIQYPVPMTSISKIELLNPISIDIFKP